MMFPVMAGVAAAEPVPPGITDLWSGQMNDILVPDVADTGDMSGLHQDYPLNSESEGL